MKIDQTGSTLPVKILPKKKKDRPQDTRRGWDKIGFLLRLYFVQTLLLSKRGNSEFLDVFTVVPFESQNCSRQWLNSLILFCTCSSLNFKQVLRVPYHETVETILESLYLFYYPERYDLCFNESCTFLEAFFSLFRKDLLKTITFLSFYTTEISLDSGRPGT